jgi:hypothetical protein
MDRDIATIILSSSQRSVRELDDVIPIIKEHCSEQDYYALKKAISSAIYDIMQDIGKYVRDRCPELDQEIENRMNKYGRMF